MEKEVSNGSNLKFEAAVRRTRNVLRSIKGELYSSDSSQSSSIESEGLEFRLGDYIDTGSIGATYRALD